MTSIKLSMVKEYDEFIIASETDTKGVITYASQGFCDISGYSKDELIGQPHNIVRDPENDPAIFKDLWGRLQKGETVVIESLSNKSKNGEIYHTYAKFHPIYKGDEIVGYRSLRKDITDKVKLEKMYQQLLNTF